MKVQSREQQGEMKILTKCTHFHAMRSSPCWRNAALVWIHDCLYCISGEQALITKTTFNWACVYKMLPSCSSFTYQNKWVLWSSLTIICIVVLYINCWITFCLDEVRCVKNNVRDIFSCSDWHLLFFSPQCLKLRAARIRFTWSSSRFRRQTDQSEGTYLLISDRKLSLLDSFSVISR